MIAMIATVKTKENKMMVKAINLRTKTEKRFADNVTTVKQDVESFLKMRNDDAEFLLWQLIYRTDRVEFSAQNFKTPLTEELMSTFCNELRYQRRLVDASFMEIPVPIGTECSITDAFLCKKLDQMHKWSKGSLLRIIHLFKSEEEDNIFGAIRSLGYGYYAADFLMQYSEKIGEIVCKIANDILEDLDENYTEGENTGFGKLNTDILKGVVFNNSPTEEEKTDDTSKGELETSESEDENTDDASKIEAETSESEDENAEEGAKSEENDIENGVAEDNSKKLEENQEKIKFEKMLEIVKEHPTNFKIFADMAAVFSSEGVELGSVIEKCELLKTLATTYESFT